MPIPALAALVANKVGQTKQNIMNLATTWWLNNDQKKFSREMYQRQREDALSDWNMQNEFNSPAAQMKRFKEAGLNPNLIYGQTNTAAPTRSSSVEGYNPHYPETNFNALGQSIMDSYDLELKDAQKDNLKAAALVSAQEAAMKAVQIEGLLTDMPKRKNEAEKSSVDLERSKFDFQQAQKLSSISLEAATEQLRKLRTETDISINRDEREAAMNSSNLREAVERIATLRAQRAKTETERSEIMQRVDNLIKDGTLKQMEIEMKKNGVMPGDWIWFRRIDEALRKTRPAVRRFFGLE